MSRAQVIVAGGGPAGLAFACAAHSLDVTVVEASPRREAPTPETFDTRVFALSPGTRDFLRECGAWDALAMRRIAPVRRMEVFGDAGARLDFPAPPRGALAWIVEANRLAAALEACAARAGHVTMLRGIAAQGFRARASGAEVDLADGRQLGADLLVGADGPDSPVREALGFAIDRQAYDERAIVANFEVEREHEGIARQWFRADGVLAWLPLPGRRISIVWSAPRAVADELASLEPDALARRVRDAGGALLGDLVALSPSAGFALRSIRVDQPVAPGVALIGDAAHAVHPLAGQGINLGFEDARCLAEVLGARSALERPGDLAVLRRHARARREEVGAMHWVTHGLDRLFATDSPGASAFRNLGMRVIDAQPWAKRLLAGRAMR